MLLLALVAPICSAPPVHADADPLVVTSLADSGPGSLRGAIALAEPGDTIVFAESLAGEVIALASTLVVDKNLTIGNTVAETHVTLSGEHAVRILEVRSGAEVMLVGLALVKGGVAEGDGGAIRNEGMLVLVRCIVNANRGEVGGAIYNAETGMLAIDDSQVGGNQATMHGGAIYNAGALSLVGSTIHYNVAALQGGAILNDDTGTARIGQCTLDRNGAGQVGGAVMSPGRLAITHSTLSRNSAADGGALLNGRDARITNSTFADNEATGDPDQPDAVRLGGGGIANLGNLLLYHVTLSGNRAAEGLAGGLSHVSGTAIVRNTLIAHSSPAADCQVRQIPDMPVGTFEESAGHLIEDGSCEPAVSGDPMLGELGDNGGSTETILLLPGSPAINAADSASCSSTDQREVDRLQGGYSCDIGAVEMRVGYAATLPPVDVTASGAVLRGEVTAPDWAVTSFHLGTTGEYGTIVAADPGMLTAASDASFSAALDDLDANTTYYYRAVADTGAVVAYGENATFTTDIRPAAAVTDPATDVTSAGATLHGTVIAHNSDTRVIFQYGPTTSYGSVATPLPAIVTGLAETPVMAPVAGLDPSMTYHYRVVGASAGGMGCGADATFTTDAIAPTVATGGAEDITATGATLHATVNGHGAPTEVWFEYGLDAAYGQTVAAVPGALTVRANTAASAALEELTPETTYHYRAVAQSAGGTVYGEDATFATPEFPPHPGHVIWLPLVQR